MTRRRLTAGCDSLRLYFAEISRHPILTVEEERALARAYRETGETSAAHRLVVANLRFVVKIAYTYRSSRVKVIDLIQEGNIGLMKAVKKFDPERGLRLISYAVWWIRSSIQNHILTSHSLVKVGTSRSQRVIFFSLARARRDVERSVAERGSTRDGDDYAKIAEKLNVTPREVEEMTHRMKGRDVSLDAPIGNDGTSTHLDLLPGTAPLPDRQLADAQLRTLIQRRIGEALARLNPRERSIIERRVMSDQPMTLTALGADIGVGCERARQMETRAKQKLKRELLALAAEIGWPTNEPSSDEDGCAVA